MSSHDGSLVVESLMTADTRGRVRVHSVYGPLVTGVYVMDAWTIDGKTMQVFVDGRLTVPIAMGADPSTVRFADSLPAPVVTIPTPVTDALAELSDRVESRTPSTVGDGSSDITPLDTPSGGGASYEGNPGQLDDPQSGSSCVLCKAACVSIGTLCSALVFEACIFSLGRVGPLAGFAYVGCVLGGIGLCLAGEIGCDVACIGSASCCVAFPLSKSRWSRPDVGASGSDRRARRADRAGHPGPSRTGIALAADAAHVAHRSQALAAMLARRAVRVGGAGLVDAARVAGGADAVVGDALPLSRVVRALYAEAVELAEVAARHFAGARRELRDVGVRGRAGRRGGGCRGGGGAAAEGEGGGGRKEKRAGIKIGAHGRVLRNRRAGRSRRELAHVRVPTCAEWVARIRAGPCGAQREMRT